MLSLIPNHSEYDIHVGWTCRATGVVTSSIGSVGDSIYAQDPYLAEDDETMQRLLTSMPTLACCTTYKVLSRHTCSNVLIAAACPERLTRHLTEYREETLPDAITEP